MAKANINDSLLQYLTDSPTPFHAVENIKSQFPGIQILKENEIWNLEYNKTYLITRADSSIIGFRTPKKKANPDQLQFKIIAAHTDSPCLRLKPNSKKSTENYVQWGCEVYGGVLIHSWLDRDLHIAGRVTLSEKGVVKSWLIKLEDASIRVPQLAIHLNRKVNDDGFKLNKQKHLVPVLGLEGCDLLKLIYEKLEKDHGVKLTKKQKEEGSLYHDLYLYDACSPSYGGLEKEFIYSGRLDNLAMCHASMHAFLEEKSVENTFQVFACFDHEEVGSNSAQGAMSSFLTHALERMALSFSFDTQQFLAAASRSIVISADMAHALHPNYTDRHDEDHRPLIGKGPVIKFNANQRYMTNSISAAYLADLCRMQKIPHQHFVSRTDMSCGSTIGPYVASQLGMETVDVGNPMLSMHSIREMTGCEDHLFILKLFQAFYNTPYVT